MIIHIQSFPDHNRVYNTNIYICSLQLSIYLIGFFFCVCVFCFFFFNSEQFPPGYVIIVTVAVADFSAEQ